MGSFAASGIQAELQRFDGLAKGVNEACEKAVAAGAKALAERLKQAAPERTGALRRSIKASKVEYNATEGFHSRVEPVGKDARGEPYAKIGNILEYGRSNMPARPWFNPTLQAAEAEVARAMQEAFDEAQSHE